jgi:cell wall-associated NlpC family hydrolase
MSDPVGSPGGFPPPSPSAAAVPPPGPPSERALRFLEAARAQCRSSAPADPNDETFDCSELVAWAAGQVDLTVPDDPHELYSAMEAAGALVDVTRAVATPGALLFTSSEPPKAAISVGDGTVIESRGTPDGVGVFPVGDRFDAGAVIPGLGAAPPPAPAPVEVGGTVPDGIVVAPLPDHYDVSYALAPDEADTSGDGVTDRYDVVAHGARAMDAEPGGSAT